MNHKRAGYGTRILDACVRFAEKHELKKIEIEQIMTQPMENFAEKHGFSKKTDFEEECTWVKEL